MKCKLFSIVLILALSLCFSFIPQCNVIAAEHDNDKIWTTRKTVDGIEYSLTVDLTEWDESASRDGLRVFEDMFFEVYPQMYDRFGFYSSATTDVKLLLTGSISYIATANWQTGTVKVNQKHYADNPDHYDYFVHELAHLLQNGWDYNYIEYDNYIQTFADYCRYVYAYKDGKYNDCSWELNTAAEEKSRENSIRFLVWLDMETSSSNRDIIRDYFEMVFDKSYPRSKWGEAWQHLFKGTKFENQSIDHVWEIYADSDFGSYDAKVSKMGDKSELIKKTDVRNYIKKHSYSEIYEAKLKGKTLEKPATQNKEDESTNISNASYEFGKNVVDGRYVFNTHILNRNADKITNNMTAFYNMCEALRRGEDTFDCANEEVYNLAMNSDVIRVYFPFAYDKIKGAGFENGKGKIEYLIPKDEFTAKEKEYEKQIEEILNNCVEPGWLEHKKAIALYDYVSENYSNELERNTNYIYLLLQAGVWARLDVTKDDAKKPVAVINITGTEYTYNPEKGQFVMY